MLSLMKLLHSPLDLQTFLKRKNVIIKELQTLHPELCSYPPEFGLSNSPFFFDGFNIKRRLLG